MFIICRNLADSSITLMRRKKGKKQPMESVPCVEFPSKVLVRDFHVSRIDSHITNPSFKRG
jgi:hypothetical protein